jgi:hypothetical protein
MSSGQDQARRLAERIALRLSEGNAETQSSRGGGDVGQELSVVRASLEELQQRLARIESHVTGERNDESQAARVSGSPVRRSPEPQPEQPATQQQQVATRSPWLSGMYVPAAHPSQERFGIEEAAVSELVDFFEGEKKCELEPGGKPCDHCSMCSTRGF